MARSYIIGGHKVRRRSIVKLDAEARLALADSGRVTVRYPVEWPIADSIPDMENAQIDPGGTDIWGPGPYLKVPNHGSGGQATNRVFCPWGYPPDRVRIARSKHYLEIASVSLDRRSELIWDWVIELFRHADTDVSD